MLRNTPEEYGWVAIILHWLTAAFVISLFALGLYMVGLDYYDELYYALPFMHKSIGILFVLLLLLRLVWRLGNPIPAPVAGTSPLEALLARLVRQFFYLLIGAILISGYLISTADGSPISVFDLFHLPATMRAAPQQADSAGLLHQYLSYALVTLAVLHALAALKHHFIKRDQTLRRMLGLSMAKQESKQSKQHGVNA